MTHQELLIRNTASTKGRSISITPTNTSLVVLSCGRIILDREVNEVSANSEEQEVALICLKGEGVVTIDSETYPMKRYDGLYVPPKTAYQVTTESELDLVESSAPSEKQSEPQFVSFESVKNDSKLHLTAGEQTYVRDVYRVIDDNVDASRLICGLTFGKPGNWTSWAPHEHAQTKEEVYLFIDMPKPAFGIQIMYRDLSNVDFIAPVFEDDAVIITQGYHPNVGIPGRGINFVWMMAALRPEIDRDWTKMQFDEEFGTSL
ncbi:MAG: 5-deoxy-glucuronate isomerase [Acidobacteriota bacterium]